MERCYECSATVSCLKFRTEAHSTEYTLFTAIAYFFYPPLYIAGPTTTYNAWISQLRTP